MFHKFHTAFPVSITQTALRSFSTSFIMTSPDSDKLILLITGGNQGLGYHAIQQLSATGKYRILMGARDVKKAKAAIETLADDHYVNAHPEDVKPVTIDMSSDASIEAAVQEVEQKFGRLDILMVNAGIGHAAGTTREQFQQIYDTNVFGTVVTVETFIPLLRKSTLPGGKRIAFTTSDLGSIEMALESDGLYSAKNFPYYRSSKTAVNMMMASFAKQLEGEGFVVSAANPGFCGTGFNNNSGPKDPREGAKELVKAATGRKEDVHARVVSEEGVSPW